MIVLIRLQEGRESRSSSLKEVGEREILTTRITRLAANLEASRKRLYFTGFATLE